MIFLHFAIAISCLYFMGCAHETDLDRKYKIVREEVEINKVRIENGLKPIWTNMEVE